MNNPLISSLRQSPIVAILRLDDLTDAVSIVRGLWEGGIRYIEFTLTNPDAPRQIQKLRNELNYFEHGEGMIGLGSVRNLDEAKLAYASGAQFVVCPITDCEIIRYCKCLSLPVMPGAMTPTEIHRAWSEGADVIKLFPASTLGPSYLKDLLAPMPFLPIMPTGGVQLENIAAYLQAGAVAVGMGSNLLPKAALATKDWGLITAACQKYLDAAEIAR